MRGLIAAAMAATMLPAAISASEIGDQLAQHLYDGTLAETTEASFALCNETGEADACFAAGLIDLIGCPFMLSWLSLGNRRTDPRNNQANDKQHQEHEKQYLCDIACRAGDATKTEYRGDQGDHQKCKCPAQHDAPFPFQKFD